MSGQIAASESGDLFFIPDELREVLLVTATDAGASADEVQAYGMRSVSPQPSPPRIPSLDITSLDAQWSKFQPSFSINGRCSDTDDSGGMGCPG